MIDENAKQDELLEKSPNNATLNDEPEMLDKIVRTNCTVCRSGHLKEIHAWRKSMTLREISDKLKSTFHIDIAKDALSRHFLHYSKLIRVRTMEKEFLNFDEKLETLTQHQRQTLFLTKITFQHLMKRLEAGTLDLTIADFEKLVNLYYRVLRDPDRAGDEDIIAIFQRASDKYGATLDQGVMVMKPSLPVRNVEE